MITSRQTQANSQDRARQSDSTISARAMIYHALAEALAGPTPGIQALLLETATIGAQTLNSVACQEAALTLAKLPPTGPEVLDRCYTRLITNPGRRPVALYESLHRGGGLMGQFTWEVERHYQALGVAPVAGELPDHASVELAFLGHLAAAEAEARTAGDGRLVARIKAEQRYFLRTHAGAWLPEVGMALASADNRFYAAVGRLLSGFLAEELTGRKQNGQARIRLPTLKDPHACTLCGLCAGSCPLGALRVIESATETALALNPGQCIGCNRCERICPEAVLILAVAEQTDQADGQPSGDQPSGDQPSGSQPSRFNPAKRIGSQVMRRSPRAECPHCGQPTVSQAELKAVLARLRPDPAMEQRLCLCVECKSWSA